MLCNWKTSTCPSMSSQVLSSLGLSAQHSTAQNQIGRRLHVRIVCTAWHGLDDILSLRCLQYLRWHCHRCRCLRRRLMQRAPPRRTRDRTTWARRRRPPLRTCVGTQQAMGNGNQNNWRIWHPGPTSQVNILAPTTADLRQALSLPAHLR